MTNTTTGGAQTEPTSASPTVEAKPPSDSTETPQVTDSSETLERYKQRFRTVMFGSAQRAGVSHAPVRAAMHKLEVGEYDPTPGMMVSYFDHALLATFPPRTILVAGEPGDAHHCVVGVGQRGGEMRALLGRMDADGFPMFAVETMPGVIEADWVSAPSSVTELEAIRQFQRRAWEVGMEAKSEQSWCGEVDHALMRAGISVECTNPPGVVETVTPQQCRELPEGTILRYTTPTRETALYRRDPTANNPARTLSVGGVLPGYWAQSMTVVHRTDSGQRMDVQVMDSRELNSMPIGTRIADRGDRRNYWEKIPNQRWRALTGIEVPSSRFYTVTMVYTVIP